MRVCPVLPAHVGAMLLALRELVGMLSLRARLPQIEVATSGAGEDSVTVLVMRVLDAPTEGDMSRLRAFAAAHRVSIWLQPGGPSTAAPLDPTETSRLTLALPEFDVEIPFLPTEFTQVNHRMNEVLVRRAVHLLAPQPDDHVVDFFCGLGNFSLALARRAASVVGIEGSAALVARAEQAATRNALAGRARFFVRNLFEWTEDDFERLAAERGAPQRVLIDPPREGALCVARSLVRLRNGPRRVVYVSCNPATLARDCAVLVHEGAWRLRGAGVVDMFPHTSHVESIAVLEPGPGR
jgi:23S rRNA (uracil1939-C5)-methyltransferase